MARICLFFFHSILNRTSGQKKSQFDFVRTVFYLDLFGDCLVSVKFEIGLSLSQNFWAGAAYSTSFRKIG